MEVLIRPGRPGDGAAIARIHSESSAYYADQAPALFNRPEGEGLAEFLEPGAEDNTETSLLLVADLGGEVVGSLYATLHLPHPTARFQSPSELSETRLFVDALSVLRAHWRRGIATALVHAAEQWGRERGATVALCDTWPESAVSLPFWEERMGYRQRSVRLRKPLSEE
jgi:GNAT superfamily N-acetyltransferase